MGYVTWPRPFPGRFVIRKKCKILVLSHPLGDLGATCTVHMWLARKCVVDFLLVLIEFFSLALMAAALLSENCRNWRFLNGWVTLSAIFGRWGHRPQSIYGPLDRRMM